MAGSLGFGDDRDMQLLRRFDKSFLTVMLQCNSCGATLLHVASFMLLAMALPPEEIIGNSLDAVAFPG
ncbi:MAG: hypothetical protein AAGH53_00245 [Pseudomonadota bacterium]